jgi:iron complex transport system ATP-binding protein
MSQDFILRAEQVSVSLSGQTVLQDIQLALQPGRWTSLVGPNGAGKSTLLKTLAGLLPHQGQVYFFDQQLMHMPMRERAQQLAWLGQAEMPTEELVVEDVVMLGRMPHQGWLGLPSAFDHDVVDECLRLTETRSLRGRSMGQLSGGERQRVCLARALAVQAKVVLMDEPLAHLDPPHQADWLQLVKTLRAQGTTVVSALHELSMALHADDMVLMAQGRIQHHGPCADPRTHEVLCEVFDQRVHIQALGEQWVALPHL